jgi:hypothetical protein
MDFELQKQLKGEGNKPIVVYDENHVVVWHNKTAEQLLGNSDGHKFEDVIAAYQPVIKPITVGGRQLKAAIFPDGCDCEDTTVIPADAPAIVKKAEYLIILLMALQKKKASILIGAVVLLVLSFLFVFGRVVYKASSDPRVTDAIIHSLDRTPERKCP